MIATIVDTDALWQTVVGAFVAGVGTTIVFSLAILGAARLSETSREGNRLHATFFGVLMVLGLLATLGAVVVGVVVMTVIGLVPVLTIATAIASLLGFGAVLRLGFRTVRGSARPIERIPQPVAAPTGA